MPQLELLLVADDDSVSRLVPCEVPAHRYGAIYRRSRGQDVCALCHPYPDAVKEGERIPAEPVT